MNTTINGGKQVRVKIIYILIFIAIFSLGGLIMSMAGVKTKSYVNVDAISLKLQYDENEADADATYKEKVIKVSGRIIGIGNDILNHQYVVIGGDNEFMGVQCTLSERKNTNELFKGQTITVVGTCLGKFGNVQLDKCIIQ